MNAGIWRLSQPTPYAPLAALERAARPPAAIVSVEGSKQFKELCRDAA
jgi:hypothetical protein